MIEINDGPALAIDGEPVFLSSADPLTVPYENGMMAKPRVSFLDVPAFSVEPNGNPDLTAGIKDFDVLLEGDPDTPAIIHSFSTRTEACPA